MRSVAKPTKHVKFSTELTQLLLKEMFRWTKHVRCRQHPHKRRQTGGQQITSHTKRVRGMPLYMRQFFQDTTIQGLRYIVAPKRHPFEMLLWAAIILVASLGAIFVITGSWERYVTNPTVMSLEKDYRQWATFFPAVTMCFLENLNYTRADQEIKKLWGDVEESKMQYYRDFLNALTNASLHNLNEFEKFRNDTTLDKITDLEDLASKVQIDLKYDISFMDEKTRVKFRRTLTETGLCFTWGSSVGHLFTSRKASPPSASETLVTSCRYEDLPCGIRVSKLLSDVKFYVHSTDDLPIIGTNKPHLEFRGSESQVYVQHKQIVASPELRRLDPEQRGCLFRDEVKAHRSLFRTSKLPIYTHNLCKMACRRRMAEKFCNCIPFFYRTLGDGNICNAKGMACLSSFKHNLTEDVYKRKGQCFCYQECESTDYAVDSKSTYELDSDYTYSRDSVQFFVGIKIFTKTRLRRDIIYSFEDLLVSFGGTVTLFLGCSILSSVELLYYFTLRLGCELWMKYQKKGKTHPLPEVSPKCSTR